MNIIKHSILLIVTAFFTACQSEGGFTSLINDQKLAGWANLNRPQDTWTASGNILTGTGKPTSMLRSDRHYENLFLNLRA